MYVKEIYVALDGAEFEDIRECREHENNLALQEAAKDTSITVGDLMAKLDENQREEFLKFYVNIVGDDVRVKSPREDRLS